MSNTKTLLYASSFLALILLGALVYGVLDIRSKNQSASSLVGEADGLSENDALSQSIRFVKNNSKDDIALLESFVLHEDNLVPFVELLESTGKGMGLVTSIASVSSDKSEEAAASFAPNTVHIVVETDGSWTSNLGFLHALEALPTHASIDQSTIIKGEKSWHQRTLLTVYSFK